MIAMFSGFVPIGFIFRLNAKTMFIRRKARSLGDLRTEIMRFELLP